MEKRTERMDIFLAVYRHTILVKQRWRYNWIHESDTLPWTYLEKRKFHHKLDSLIWQYCSGNFKMKVSGESAFAKKYKNKPFTLNFDIQWELGKPHWNVNAKKIKKGSFERSNVKWDAREINLDTEDTVLTQKLKDHYQYPSNHEFGHAVGNSAYAYAGGHGDEYHSTSPYYSDTQSLMNAGNELRERHIDFIIRELDRMIPKTKFNFHQLKNP